MDGGIQVFFNQQYVIWKALLVIADFCFNFYTVSVKTILEYFFSSRKKLDGVGPVDNKPSTDKLHHCQKKNVTLYM